MFRPVGDQAIEVDARTYNSDVGRTVEVASGSKRLCKRAFLSVGTPGTEFRH